MLRSGFCDYSDEYFVVKRKISLTDTDNANKKKIKKKQKANHQKQCTDEVMYIKNQHIHRKC